MAPKFESGSNEALEAGKMAKETLRTLNESGGRAKSNMNGNEAEKMEIAKEETDKQTTDESPESSKESDSSMAKKKDHKIQEKQEKNEELNVGNDIKSADITELSLDKEKEANPKENGVQNEKDLIYEQDIKKEIDKDIIKETTEGFIRENEVKSEKMISALSLNENLSMEKRKEMKAKGNLLKVHKIQEKQEKMEELNLGNDIKPDITELSLDKEKEANLKENGVKIEKGLSYEQNIKKEADIDVIKEFNEGLIQENEVMSAAKMSELSLNENMRVEKGKERKAIGNQQAIREMNEKVLSIELRLREDEEITKYRKEILILENSIREKLDKKRTNREKLAKTSPVELAVASAESEPQPETRKRSYRSPIRAPKRSPSPQPPRRPSVLQRLGGPKWVTRKPQHSRLEQSRERRRNINWSKPPPPLTPTLESATPLTPPLGHRCICVQLPAICYEQQVAMSMMGFGPYLPPLLPPSPSQPANSELSLPLLLPLPIDKELPEAQPGGTTEDGFTAGIEEVRKLRKEARRKDLLDVLESERVRYMLNKRRVASYLDRQRRQVDNDLDLGTEAEPDNEQYLSGHESCQLGRRCQERPRGSPSETPSSSSSKRRRFKRSRSQSPTGRGRCQDLFEKHWEERQEQPMEPLLFNAINVKQEKLDDDVFESGELGAIFGIETESASSDEYEGGSSSEEEYLERCQRNYGSINGRRSSSQSDYDARRSSPIFNRLHFGGHNNRRYYNRYNVQKSFRYGNYNNNKNHQYNSMRANCYTNNKGYNNNRRYNNNNRDRGPYFHQRRGRRYSNYSNRNNNNGTKFHELP